MILQRDMRLNASINKYGCYYMSILFLCNKYRNVELSTGMINELYVIFQDTGWMDNECFINDPQAIFGYMGLQVYYYDRHDPPFYKCKKDEIEILRFQYVAWKHFVVGDGLSHVTYDPYGTSKAVRLGELRDKRVFRIQR
ncbi:MAG: DUF261 family protein [Candidatus Thorarchaeota archaeon]|jgi:hypothetical protein